MPIDFITKHLDDVIYYEDTRRLIENLQVTLENVRKDGRHKKSVPDDCRHRACERNNMPLRLYTPHNGIYSHISIAFRLQV